MKKLLFLLILLIPFVVSAESDFAMVKIWEQELPDTYYNTYYLNDKFIKITDRKIVSVDALTGETKTVEFENGFRYSIYDNRILTIAENEQIEITLYNENLTQLNKETIEYFKIDHSRMYNNKYIIISGHTSQDSQYTRYVYFIDSEGKIYKSDKKKTLNYVYKYKDENNNYFYMDNYGNRYIINDYKIISDKQNNDGSYVVNYENKLIKHNASGNKVGELTMPTGKSPNFIKKGNYYYAITYVNKTVNAHYSYKVVLYKIDSNLNIVSTSEQYPEEYVETNASTTPYAFDYRFYRLYDINNKIIMVLSGNNQSSYYEIGEDLTITPIETANIPVYQETNDYRYVDAIYEYNKISYNNNIPEPIEQANLNLLLRPNDSNEIGLSYKVIHDKENNYYVNVLTRSERNTKLELVKINSSGEIIFKKLIYDWTRNGSPPGELCPIYVNNNLDFYDDYIVVAANNTHNNIIKIYDTDGNEIYDMSEEVNKHPELSFGTMKIYDRGLFFEYDYKIITCLEGVSEIVNTNPNVLGETDYPTKTYMVFYELPFLVNTKVNGAGNVTAKQIRALTGSRVEFTVTPDPGFVLSVVKVIDANGNVLTFTNNTFVMPSADVTIEATFVAKNPNTQSFITYTLLGICAATGLLTVFLSSKKKQYE